MWNNDLRKLKSMSIFDLQCHRQKMCICTINFGRSIPFNSSLTNELSSLQPTVDGTVNGVSGTAYL